MLNYKFIQACEINNVEFKEGDIIAPDQGIDFFGEVMTTTDENPTVAFKKTSKVEVEKVSVTGEAENAKATNDGDKPLNKMNKDELVAVAKELGCDVVAEDTKASLTEKIEAKKAENAKAE